MAEPEAPRNPLLHAVASRPLVAPTTPLARAVWAAAGIAAIAVVVALMLAPSFWPLVTRMDHWTADWRTAYFSKQLLAQHPRVVVVTITDETLRNYVSSPIDRGLLANIVQAIDRAGAAVIGLDILFLKATEPIKDEQLIQAVRGSKAKIVLGAADARVPLLPFQREFQAAYLSRAEAPVGYVNTRHENDDVVRYTANPGPGSAVPKSFARLMAEAAGAGRADDLSAPIPWLLPAADGAPAFLAIPAEKLLGPNTAAVGAALKDRVVLVGGEFPFRDRHRVPLSVRTGQDVAGVYIHATVVAGLLDAGSQLSEVAPVTIRLLLAALAVLAIGLGLALWQTNAVTFLGHGFAVAVLLAVDVLCFTQLRLLLPFTLAVTAWVAGITAGRFLGAVFRPNVSLKPKHAATAVLQGVPPRDV
jgi:adenylate cyclase